MKSRALFLDRDGVINVDRGYVCTQESFEFVEGIFDLCRHAATLDYAIVVVTNQAGIGRGYYSEQAFRELTDWMYGVFRAEGAPIRKLYYCPFHPEHGVGAYRMHSSDRKPGPGMILQARIELDLDLGRSVLVGDKETDIEAGLAAGIGCNLLYLGQRDLAEERLATRATATVSRLSEVIPFLTAKRAAATF